MTKEEREALEAHLKGIVQNLPEKPGSYQYYDDEGTIIYVGKAKNLKRRVSSYFNKEQQSRKTALLVSKIRNITYTVVNSEEDALLLENSLIKQYKPRYNVLLKDDKTYPYIAISNEYLPRVFKTRHRERRGATYYGPYSHLPTMYALLDLCQRLYHPRPCHQPMTEEGVKSGKYDLCLNYHIRKCAGPCVLGKQSHEDYLRNIEACREILKGHTREVAEKLREEMATLAEQLRFEEAAALKKKYDLVENFRAKSEVVSNVSYDIDVSPSKATRKSRLSTSCTWSTEPSRSLLPSNSRKNSMKTTKRSSPWALWRCASAFRLDRPRLCSPSSWNFPRDMPNRWCRKWAESVRSSTFRARM